MGQLIYFCAAEETAMREAITRRPWQEAVRDASVVQAPADFSLNLSPIDMELLFEQLGCGPAGSYDALSRNLSPFAGTDSWGADLLEPQAVRRIAELPQDGIERLVESWLAAVAEEYGIAPPPVTPDMRQALENLLAACRVATQRGMAVFHLWSL